MSEVKATKVSVCVLIAGTRLLIKSLKAHRYSFDIMKMSDEQSHSQAHSSYSAASSNSNTEGSEVL